MLTASKGLRKIAVSVPRLLMLDDIFCGMRSLVFGAKKKQE